MTALRHHHAIDPLTAKLQPVGSEIVDLERAEGRVLAEPLLADRDSPPCDLSAMDGYAVRRRDLERNNLDVAGEIAIGCEPPLLPTGRVLRIVTGAPVPREAELVIRREDVVESPSQIAIRRNGDLLKHGHNIRRQGENLAAGQEVVPRGTRITPAVIAALAAFGKPRVIVHRRVRIGIITTGNELLPVHAAPCPWQIRDSNGPALASLFSNWSVVELADRLHVADEPHQIERALVSLVETSDLVILSGGVSAGDHDHVPAVVAHAGADVMFHGLPIRPGKPILGAIGRDGQAIFGLPGNPVSVLVTARRFVTDAVARLAGLPHPPSPALVRIAHGDGKKLDLWWYRSVRLTEPGEAGLVKGRGSGDIVSAAGSDGFIELPPNADAAGRWPFYPWNIT